MNMDGLTMSVLCRELAEHTNGGQLNRIIQIDKHSLVLKINRNGVMLDLMITVGNRPACYIARSLQDLPKEPSSLCMFLRKHYEGSRITAFEQLNGDRILRITTDNLALDGSLSTKQIYIELMGKYSNCIFVDKGIILESLIHVSPLMSQERTIAPKLPYELPPNANRVNLLDFSESEISQLLESFPQADVTSTLRAIFNGIGPQLLKEICFRSGIDTGKGWTELTGEEKSQLAATLYAVSTEIKAASSLLRYTTAKGKYLYSPVRLTALENQSSGSTDENSPVIISNLSAELEEEVHQAGSINTATRQLEGILRQALQKEAVRFAKIEKELADCTKADEYKLYGDLLMINAYLPSVYQTSITVSNLLADPPEDITIALRPALTLAENAQHYYRRYTKLKNRLIYGTEQARLSREHSEYIESILFSLTTATDKDALQEVRQECEEAGLIKTSRKQPVYKGKKDHFLRIPLEDGEIIIGRNNQQNEQLTHRLGRPEDLWFHAQKIHGSHVLLRTAHEPADEDILKAARYAAFFSRSRSSAKVPVDYTAVKNVKKVPASPLGFVTYTGQRTVYVDPLDPEK